MIHITVVCLLILSCVTIAVSVVLVTSTFDSRNWYDRLIVDWTKTWFLFIYYFFTCVTDTESINGNHRVYYRNYTIVKKKNSHHLFFTIKGNIRVLRQSSYLHFPKTDFFFYNIADESTIFFFCNWYFDLRRAYVALKWFNTNGMRWCRFFCWYPGKE